MLTEETGLKISAQAPEQAERDLSDAFSVLVRDPDLRIRMGEAARRRMNEVFDWEAKGRVWQRFYEEALRSTAERGPR